MRAKEEVASARRIGVHWNAEACKAEEEGGEEPAETKILIDHKEWPRGVGLEF